MGPIVTVESRGARHAHAHDAASSAGTHIDPVCGMSVTEQAAAGSFAYGGKTYFFCCPECKGKFDRS